MGDVLSEDRPLSTEEMRAEVANSNIRALEWGDIIDGDNGHEMEFLLPHGCRYSGMVQDKDYRIEMTGGFLKVSKELRGQHIGERLVKAALARGKALGATVFTTAVESQYALNIFVSIFGEDIEFSTPEPKKEGRGLQEIQLPAMTAAEARASLERAETYEADPESREHGIYITAPVSALNTTDWELAISEFQD